MTQVQVHAVQPFVKTSKGRVGAAQIQMCTGPEQAKRLAERLVEQKKAVGALAYTRSGNDSEAEFGEPTFIARIGEVPESDEY